MPLPPIIRSETARKSAPKLPLDARMTRDLLHDIMTPRARLRQRMHTSSPKFLSAHDCHATYRQLGSPVALLRRVIASMGFRSNQTGIHGGRDRLRWRAHAICRHYGRINIYDARLDATSASHDIAISSCCFLAIDARRRSDMTSRRTDSSASPTPGGYLAQMIYYDDMMLIATMSMSRHTHDAAINSTPLVMPQMPF